MRAFSLTIAVLLCSLQAGICDEPTNARDASTPGQARDAKPNRPSAVSEERESAALAFVRQHHPELVFLLEQLKAMKPAEYDRAILELFQTNKQLTNLKQRDSKRYELALEAWKAKSKAQLLAARWVSEPSEALEGQLRDALGHQIDVEVRQQKLEKELLEARLKKTEETLKRFENNRDKLLESRLQALKNRGQRARRPAAGKLAPARPARSKGDSKA